MRRDSACQSNPHEVNCEHVKSLNSEVTCGEAASLSVTLQSMLGIRSDLCATWLGCRLLYRWRCSGTTYLEARPAAAAACQRRACEEPPPQQCGYAAHNSEQSATSDVCCVHSAARDAFCQVDRFWPASQVPY